MAQANPKQKQMYKTMVIQAVKLLSTPEQAAVVKTMASQGDPAEAIASVTAMVLKQIQGAAKSAGHDLDLRFIIPAGKEIIGHMVEMIVAFKVIPHGEAQQVTQQAIATFQDIVGGGKQPQQPQQQPSGLLAQGA